MYITGYPMISRFLEGELLASNEDYRKLIDLFSGSLTQSIEPIELLPPLLQYGTITHDDARLDLTFLSFFLK